MNKKNYIKPEMVVIETEESLMLTMSDTKADKNIPAEAKRRRFIDDIDEE